MRNIEFAQGEYYHLCNRGVDKRQITQGARDSERFIQSLDDFNTTTPTGGLFAMSTDKRNRDQQLDVLKNGKPLVNIICYCLNPNHFHLLLEEITENGIARFMHKISMGYSKYFNAKYRRTGALFSGPFRARRISNNDDLLHTSIYVGLNYKVHQYGSIASKLVRSSWDEYAQKKSGLCKKEIILDQFKNPHEYEKFANETLSLIIDKKFDNRALESLGIEL